MFPGRYRATVLEAQPAVLSRVRMHGATGIDLAYVAAGILGGAISFGHHVRDHAAGVALIRAAGRVVTDLTGEQWTPASSSALARARSARTDARDRGICRRTGGLPMTTSDVATRVIPCLDVDAGRVVRASTSRTCAMPGIRSSWPRPMTPRGRRTDIPGRHRVSSGQATMPRWCGAPPSRCSSPDCRREVRAVEDVDVLLRAGADKVSVNTAAIARPDLLAEMARQFGSQCIVLSVDARTVPAGSAPTESGWG